MFPFGVTVVLMLENLGLTIIISLRFQ